MADLTAIGYPGVGMVQRVMDEVDRLFAYPFASEVFGLFRSWHNERALRPYAPWRQLTLAIAYATEAHLFISELLAEHPEGFLDGRWN